MRLRTLSIPLALLALVSISSCRSSTESTPATEARAGSYTYLYQEFGAQPTSVIETLTKAVDSLNHISITGHKHTENDLFTLDPSGDWLNTQTSGCGIDRYGFVTHLGYSSYSGSSPVKRNGQEATGHVDRFTSYLGSEFLVVGSKWLLCSKVSVTVHVWTEVPPGDPMYQDEAVIVTYWYSPDVRCFARITTESSTNGVRTLTSQHDLISWKLS
jgi:hypothetical protein